MREHPIRDLEIPELAQLWELSTSLEQALREDSRNRQQEFRASLKQCSVQIPHDAIPDPIADIKPLSADSLPLTGGIYLFTNPDGNAYVGLTENIRVRFLIPTYGHLTPKNNSRSVRVLNNPEWEVRVLETYSRAECNQQDLFINLAADEIFWYYFLLNHPNYNMQNVLGNIGSTPEHRGFPVVSYSITTGAYNHHPSMAAAARFAQTDSGNTRRHILRQSEGRRGEVRFLKTLRGVEPLAYYAFRFVTDREAGLLTPDGDGVDLVTIIEEDESDCALFIRGGENSHRNSRFQWNYGLYLPEVGEQLQPYMRGDYETDGLQSQFTHGISWHSHGEAWQVRAKSGPNYEDLWQIRCVGMSEIEAARFRELQIVENGWQDYNRDAVNGYPSNADELNPLLAADLQVPRW